MPHRALPLRGRSAVLRIEPVPVSPRLRGQRPLTPPAFGLRAPLGRPHPAPDSPGRKRPPRPFGVPTPFRRRHPLPVRYCVIRGLCSSAGRGRDGAVSPVTGRAAAANSQYGAATRRRAAVPARRRAAPTAHPRGGRAAAAWRRAGLWLSRKGGWPVAPVSPAVSGDLRPVSGGVRRGRLPCPDGHKNM
uniref:Minor silk ampullate protein n=1 Tax=Escherichia coli TaxID=562 RepID=A0A142EAZ5_ECOLX|nr:hypothetical protein [Escherichia coli]